MFLRWRWIWFPSTAPLPNLSSVTTLALAGTALKRTIIHAPPTPPGAHTPSQQKKRKKKKKGKRKTLPNSSLLTNVCGTLRLIWSDGNQLESWTLNYCLAAFDFITAGERVKGKKNVCIASFLWLLHQNILLIIFKLDSTFSIFASFFFSTGDKHLIYMWPSKESQNSFFPSCVLLYCAQETTKL